MGYGIHTTFIFNFSKFKLILRHVQHRTALWVIRRLKHGGDVPFIQSMKGVKIQLHSAFMHNVCAILAVSTFT
jgi:hypothetical protein